MTTFEAPILCFYCARLHDVAELDDPLRCDAYPAGIPMPILDNAHDHRQPYEGDGGIVFAKAPEARQSDIDAVTFTA